MNNSSLTTNLEENLSVTKFSHTSYMRTQMHQNTIKLGTTSTRNKPRLVMRSLAHRPRGNVLRFTGFWNNSWFRHSSNKLTVDWVSQQRHVHSNDKDSQRHTEVWYKAMSMLANRESIIHFLRETNNWKLRWRKIENPHLLVHASKCIINSIQLINVRTDVRTITSDFWADSWKIDLSLRSSFRIYP